MLPDLGVKKEFPPTVTEAEVLRELLKEALNLFSSTWELCDVPGTEEWEWKWRARYALDNPTWAKDAAR